MVGITYSQQFGTSLLVCRIAPNRIFVCDFFCVQQKNIDFICETSVRAVEMTLKSAVGVRLVVYNQTDDED
jgi:hypothetical protein